MSEGPPPTYRVEPGDEQERFVCLIPDAGKPEGVCGMVCRTLDYLRDHMQQMHSGVMVEENASTTDETPQPKEGEAAPTSGPTAQAEPVPAPATEAPPRGTPPSPPVPPSPPTDLPEEPPASDAAGQAA